ncbi:MAG: hypothetical protein JWM95_2817 [Gemmatimonadetes bacterium]|nr:hypothetical protein [Gemmatimonadota bacterium]
MNVPRAPIPGVIPPPERAPLPEDTHRLAHAWCSPHIHDWLRGRFAGTSFERAPSIESLYSPRAREDRNAVIVELGVLPARERTPLLDMLCAQGRSVYLCENSSSCGARTICQAIRAGVADAFLAGAENELCSRGMPLLRRRRASRIELFVRLASRVDRLPDPLIAVVVGLFVSGGVAILSRNWAKETGMWRRTIDRNIARAGLASASIVTRAAQLSWAWDILVRPDGRVIDAALRSGFGSTRSLVATFRRAAGITPRQAGRDIDERSFLDRITDYVTKETEFPRPLRKYAIVPQSTKTQMLTTTVQVER